MSSAGVSTRLRYLTLSAVLAGSLGGLVPQPSLGADLPDSTSSPSAISATKDGALVAAPVASAAVPVAVGTASGPSKLPPNLVSSPDVGTNAVEIDPAAAAASQAPSAAPSPASDDDTAAQERENPEIAKYEAVQSGMVDPTQVQGLREFMAEGPIESPIGVELEEARRKLSGGGEADGLLVVEVAKGSPAEQAGLRAWTRTGRNVLIGAAVAAAVVMPPAIFLVPMIDYAQVGERYDMIIGVDGERVTNFLDFQDRMRDLQPGEIVYLSLVRDGHRLQIKVSVPRGYALQ